jgi:hypothetical protein
MTAPSVQAAEIERHARLPAGAGERFTGYGVMGLPFASGHVLAMRRFPASSIGPAYTSVWHRDPAGRWDFWQNQPGDQACSRYFGSALAGTRRAHIELDWPGEYTLRIAIAEAGFTWRMTMAASAATRVLNTIGALLPDRVWRAAPCPGANGTCRGHGAARRPGRHGRAGTQRSGVRGKPQVDLADRKVIGPAGWPAVRPAGPARPAGSSRRPLDPPARSLRHRPRLLQPFPDPACPA